MSVVLVNVLFPPLVHKNNGSFLLSYQSFIDILHLQVQFK